MPRIDIDSLPDESRIWIFAAAAPLAAEQKQAVLRESERFAGAWQSHGEPVPAAVDLIEDRFLVVAVPPEVAAGGCSIDGLFRLAGSFRSSAGVDLLDSSRVYWRDGGEIRSESRARFRALAEAGEVGPETEMFDTTAETLGELRSGRWTRPAADSWHAAAFSMQKV